MAPGIWLAWAPWPSSSRCFCRAGSGVSSRRGPGFVFFRWDISCGRRERGTMAEIMPLPEAIARFVGDENSVALEGFTHLIPFAAGHEIMRQGRRDLELIRMTPDLLYDQMIGMGAARRLVFAYGGNPGVGSLHRFRDAIENGWPRELEIEEHSHAGMANRYSAGASDLPFAVMRGY